MIKLATRQALKKKDVETLCEMAREPSCKGGLPDIIVNTFIAISPNERTFGEKKLLRIALMSPYVSRETLDEARAVEMAREMGGNRRILRIISNQTLMAIRREETAAACQDA